MRIAIVAIGSRGDVQPYLALGLGLKRAGHEVRMVAPARFKTFIESYGIDFFPLNWDPASFMAGPVTESGRSIFGFWRHFFPEEHKISETLVRECSEGCQGSDLILANLVAFFGPMVGKLLGIPTLLLSAVPGYPTREIPQFFFRPLPRWVPFRGLYNQLSYSLFHAVSCVFILKQIGRLRKRIDALPAPHRFIQDSIKEKVPILHEFSPAVIPEAPEWRELFRVTGYWFLDSHPDWKPSDEILRFLADGKRPVFISFGSVIGRDPDAFARLAFDAVEAAGVRAILAGGWSSFGRINPPKDVLILDEIPHDWIFPKVAAVVHHGGAGVTAATLRAGAPSIAIPHFADQFFWGERVHALGAGPPPIPRKRLTSQKLAEAIKTAVNDQSIRRAASQLGERIRSEDGVARAVEWLEAWMSRN